MTEYANDKNQQKVMENFHLSRGQIMFHETWHYKTLVSSPRTSDYAYVPSPACLGYGQEQGHQLDVRERGLLHIGRSGNLLPTILQEQHVACTMARAVQARRRCCSCNLTTARRQCEGDDVYGQAVRLGWAAIRYGYSRYVGMGRSPR